MFLSLDTLTGLEASLNDGMIVHVFVKNMDDFAKVNSVYKSFVTVTPPARYSYGICPLMGGFPLWEVSPHGRCPLIGNVHLCI